MKRYLLSVCLVLPAAQVVRGQSNIDPTNRLAWSENLGWTNWRDAGNPAGSAGVAVGGRFLAGYIWSENAGWIEVGDGTPGNGQQYGNALASDHGVNVSVDGGLHGLAWGENVGWINFDGGALATPAQPARIDCQGRLFGYVWGENIGWINLTSADAGKFVALEAEATPFACDMNHDGTSNGRDVQAFVNMLLAGGADWRDVCSGDIEAAPDDQIDIDDVQAFVTCLMGI